MREPTLRYDELSLAQKALYDSSSVFMTDCGPSLKFLTEEQYQRAYPHLTLHSDDWQPVFRTLMAFCKNRLAPASGVGSATRIIEGDIPRPARASPPPVPKARTVTGDEARVREANGAELSRLAKLNKVNTEVHPTNPGITSMRRKNALLTMLRHGAKLKF